jgi:DNA-binding MarR family transcriptional regulator
VTTRRTRTPSTTPEMLEDQIVSALRRIVRAVDLHSRRMVEACGLTGPQIVVLRAASRLSGSPIGALARAVSLGQPTVSGILDRLEAQGLVRRERSTRDRRSVFVSVTPKGARVLRNAPSLLQDRFRAQLGQLEDWELTQMLALLQRLASMMDAEAIDAAPLLEVGRLAESEGPADGDPDPAAKPRRRPPRRG